MNNGHEKKRPVDRRLRALGYWIYSGPSMHGPHQLYYFMTKDECGHEHFSFSAAEAEAKRHAGLS